ncbi:MAG: Crp/Fnr family transcriptional regulator [Bdellovibrionales bacterium]|nr:Crp/Fnr family transcriptional regulator [Bdellovibrionales bacterium]
MDISSFGAIESLRSSLAKVVAIPPTEWLAFARMLKFRKLRKGEVYFRQGERFDEIGFVVRGLLYTYYLDASGIETVKYIATEGTPVCPYAALIQNRPSHFSAKCLEPTFLVVLRYDDLLKLYRRHVCWVNMGRIFAERLFILREERERQFQTLDAEARYQCFVEVFGKHLERIPQYLIASCIGISPVHLSRIRQAPKESTPHPQPRL